MFGYSEQVVVHVKRTLSGLFVSIDNV